MSRYEKPALPERGVADINANGCKIFDPPSMRLDRLSYEPGALVDFYEASFSAMGALCERTWHDRLQIVAEGVAAKLWNSDGQLHEIELTFAPADATAARDAAREVFPGCPLTFRVSEGNLPRPIPLERIALAGESGAHPPEIAVAEKLWRAQFPDTTRWRLAAPLKPGIHFSLLALVRCEIQSIDQHWSLHRLAISLPGGQTDESLAHEISFAQSEPQTAETLEWPRPEIPRWRAFLRDALEADLTGELAAIRSRQESYLRRELERIDDYFENYERELSTRVGRSASETSKLKIVERLAAAKAEHTRRRTDQVARHEIRVQPHLDALLVVGEPAWRGSINVDRARVAQTIESLFVPRARRWFRD